jgi:hypothetical protein
MTPHEAGAAHETRHARVSAARPGRHELRTHARHAIGTAARLVDRADLLGELRVGAGTGRRFARAPMLVSVLPSLLKSGVPKSSDEVLPRRTQPLGYKNVSRNSYRAERLERSEALHKIYVEADIRVSRRRYVHAVLVYELLYHRPAKEHDYILKDLRVVSTHSAELTLDEIIALKQVITQRFVNPCLEAGWQLNLPEVSMKSVSFDALFTVTEQPTDSVEGASVSAQPKTEART